MLKKLLDGTKNSKIPKETLHLFSGLWKARKLFRFGVVGKTIKVNQILRNCKNIITDLNLEFP